MRRQMVWRRGSPADPAVMTTDTFPLVGTPPGAAVNRIETEAIPAAFRASVCAGGTTTNYLRAGSGDVVLLLGASFVTPELDPLIGLLAYTHRVVVPELSSAEAPDGKSRVAFSSRLRSFLDGLGFDEVSIVARDDVALAALAFALTDTDRVRRLVLTFTDAPDPLDTGEPLAERLEEAQCELLVLRDTRTSHPTSDRGPQHDAIVRFLAA